MPGWSGMETGNTGSSTYGRSGGPGPPPQRRPGEDDQSYFMRVEAWKNAINDAQGMNSLWDSFNQQPGPGPSDSAAMGWGVQGSQGQNVDQAAQWEAMTRQNRLNQQGQQQQQGYGDDRFQQFMSQFGDLFGQGSGDASMSGGGGFTPQQWTPNPYEQQNYQPVQIESTKEAVDPMSVIKAQMPAIRNLMNRNTANAGAAMGASGMGGSAYAGALGKAAAEGSQQMGALYWDQMGQASEREAAREQERRMAEGGFRQQGQLDDLGRNFEGWSQGNQFAGQANQQNNQWAAEQSNQDRDWRMNQQGSLMKLWNMF